MCKIFTAVNVLQIRIISDIFLAWIHSFLQPLIIHHPKHITLSPHVFLFLSPIKILFRKKKVYTIIGTVPRSVSNNLHPVLGSQKKWHELPVTWSDSFYRNVRQRYPNCIHIGGRGPQNYTFGRTSWNCCTVYQGTLQANCIPAALTASKLITYRLW
jgi:hypothetical protein